MPTLEASAEPLTDTELRDWIREHRVCWETLTHRDVGPHGVRPVGYDVLLAARCVGPGPWDPGGERALEMLQRLKQLALAAIPSTPDDRMGMGPFEAAFQVRAQADWVPEVRVVVEIRHDHDYFDAIDDDERSCVRRLERALESWGVQANRWTDARKPQA